MIRGYFRYGSGRHRPYVDLAVRFPVAENASIEIPFLIDTGADHTLLSPTEGVHLRQELGIDLMSLPRGESIGGVGGYIETRTIETVIAIGSYVSTLSISLAEPPTHGNFPLMPSLLGWDVIGDFAIFIEQRTNRVLLLERGDIEHIKFAVG